MASVSTEDRVRDRIAREKQDLQGRIVDTEESKAEVSAEYAVSMGALTTLAKEVIDLDDKGQSIPVEKQTALNEAHAAVIRQLNKRTGLGAKVREMKERLARLGTDEEFAARLEVAHSLGDTPRKPSGRDAAIRVLLNAGGPQHYREITRIAQESGMVELKGKTPEATMNAMLSTSAKAEDTFVKVSPGVFDLIDREGQARAIAEQAARDDAPAEAKSLEPVKGDTPKERAANHKAGVQAEGARVKAAGAAAASKATPAKAPAKTAAKKPATTAKPAAAKAPAKPRAKTAAKAS